MHVQKLRNFFFPSAIHLRVFNSLYAELFNGYLHRNPMSADGQALLYRKAPIFDPTAESRARISILTGLSGMGKSALCTRVLDAFGTLLTRHTTFKGQSFAESQILYLRRNIPSGCTPRTMCAHIGGAVDLALGTPHYQSEFERRNMTMAQLEMALRRVIVNHHIGILVLDEFQNLKLIGVGADAVIATIIRLCDEYKIPVLIVGTYATHELALRESALVRRVADRYYDLARPESDQDEDWQELCQAAWSYQWVRDPIDYSEEIGSTLYKCSQGVTGIMLSTFEAAQILAMEDGSETVTAKTLQAAYNERMKMVQPLVRLLEINDPSLYSLYETRFPNCWPPALQEKIPPLIRVPTVERSVIGNTPAGGGEAPHSRKAKGSSKNTPDPIQTAVLAEPLSADALLALLDCGDVRST